MDDFFNSLFHYLEREEIQLDKSEFLYQLQSHPDYPSLLATSDTLSFFNISNFAARVQFDEIEHLPDRFVAVLSENLSNPHLYLIEKKNNIFYIIQSRNNIEISKDELKSRWNNIVLIVEKDEEENIMEDKKQRGYWFLSLLCLVLFATIFFLFEVNFQIFSFFIFPMIGLLLSIVALKDLFGAKSKLINNFCNITASTSCETVVNSHKWKIFRTVNFSDLSIVFFSSQFVGLFVLILSDNSNAFFSIQKILLLISLPVILVSLYYQKIIEKKWCPICLLIIGVILFEMMYTFLFQMGSFVISYKPLIVFAFISSTLVLIWSVLKKVLAQQKKLQEFQFKANRFLRNYEVFKNSLLSKERIKIPYSPIILGNKDGKTQITVITNPFCGHCKEVHEILDKILEKHSDHLFVKIIFKANIEIETVENRVFFQNLMGIYFEKGEAHFREALSHWFKILNVNTWLQFYKLESDAKKVEEFYNSQNDWCKENNINYTPAIFINGYEYPNVYERSNLEFFINELNDDGDF